MKAPLEHPEVFLEDEETAEEEDSDEEDEKLTEMNEVQVSKLDVRRSVKKKEKPLKHQIMGNMAMFLLCILGSAVSGYSAILFPQLQEPDSIIKITTNQESWIAAMAPLQMALGCLFSTWTMDKFGRKKSNIGCTMLAIVGWGTIYYSKTLTALLIGRVICGLYVGLSGMSTTAYIAEISDTRHRGVFLSLVALGIAGGVLLIHLLGTFLSWQNTAFIMLTLPILILCMLFYLPESHVWFLNRQQTREAREAFEWYRGTGTAATIEYERMLAVTSSARSRRTFAELRADCKQRAFYVPLAILCLFFLTTQATGTNVVTFYSVQLMQMTVPALDRYAAMMCVDVVRVVVSICASVLTKRCRVRVLLFTSAAGTVVSLAALAVCVHLQQTYPENEVYAKVPLAFLISYIFFISIGLVPLPWTVCGEILPPAMRGFGGGIACAVNFLAFFVVVKTSPFLFNVMGAHGSFALYAVLVAVGSVGLYFVLPETKNKTLQEIQEYFQPPPLAYASCDTKDELPSKT